MNIGSIFNQINNAVNNMVSMEQGTGIPASELSLSLQKGMDILSSMNAGSALTGTVAGFDEGKLILQLTEGAMIEARLEGMADPTIGQQLSFVVKGNNQGNITLSPLFANMNPSSTISGALQAAGLPDNPQTQYIVRSMMEEGLPINKDSLLDMVRTANEFPLSDPKDMAVLQRLGIPVNEEMLTQFENYKNYEHTISNSLTDIADAFIESSVSMMETQTPEETVAFLKDTLNTILPEALNEADAEVNKAQGEMAGADTAAGQVTGEKVLPEGEVLQNIISGKEGNEGGTQVVQNGAVIPDNTQGDVRNIAQDTVRDMDQNNEAVNAQNDTASKTVLKEFASLVEELSNKEHLSSEDMDKLRDLLKNDDLGKAIKNEISKQWMLKPEDVAKEGSVRELYDKLNSQIKTLAENLNQGSRPDTPIAQAANNVSGNINFMNELNQTFNYVQIPLKFDNSDKTGELYVYTNKKSLAQNDGTVSALLHLDMDNLGPVDVHVTLNESNNVKTKFMLKDDAALDLIAQNIEILNQRLNKRGYNMSAEFVNNVDQGSVFENMLSDEKNVPILSTNSFDARA
ncbi:MAG: flagellar hook-length control protein FliK [Lachnospiraceae bacterium]|nr:flagellar hook-length control protein FliK [Lachnospiraceae bacterium]